MDNYNGYKLKPKEYSIQPDDIVIRIKTGGVLLPAGQMAIALGDSKVSTSLHKEWYTYYSHWRAIETKVSSEAKAGDTVYCINDTGGSCHQHDSFTVKYANESYIWPVLNHTLLNGALTEEGWRWFAHKFVVLVKADTNEIQEFPCFRRSIGNRHVVKFTTPTKGTVVDAGLGIFDLNHTSSHWVRYDNYATWEPCSDPREIEKVRPVTVDPFEAKPGDYVEWSDDTSSRMTKGKFYKVTKTNFCFLTVLNNLNREDTWSKQRFKIVSDKTVQEPVLISSDDPIDALAYALRKPIPYIALDSMMNKPKQTEPRETSFPIYKIETGEEIICVGKDKNGWFKSVNSKGTLSRHNPRFYTLDKPEQTNSKGKQMNSNLFTDILKLLTQTEQTDLEKAPSTYAFFYNNEGEYEGTAKVASEAEAKALLQKPEHLGYTMRIYTFSDEFTTQIPVVSTIKKTVAAKPASKPRATKA